MKQDFSDGGNCKVSIIKRIIMRERFLEIGCKEIKEKIEN